MIKGGHQLTQGATSSSRFPSTVKKSNSKSTQNLNGLATNRNDQMNIQDKLVRYRALGPKIHTFGDSPFAQPPPSKIESTTIYDNYLQQRQQHLSQVISSQQPVAVSPAPVLDQQGQNHFWREKRQLPQISQPNAAGDHKNRQPLRLVQKQLKNASIGSIGSPILNQSNRSSGLFQGGNSTIEIHQQLQEVTNQSMSQGQQASNKVTISPTNTKRIQSDRTQVVPEYLINQNNRNGDETTVIGATQSIEDQSEQGTSENITITTLKTQLLTIFHFYTTFGDRQNITFLKSNKFYKMMVDAEIASQTISPTRIDLLFCQANKHQANMLFETFLDVLPKLASLKYPDSPVQDAMLLLITNQLNPLYLNIMEKTDLGVELQSFNIPLEIDCIEILTPLYPILQKIFESYFPWEPQTSMTSKKSYQKSLKALFVFLGEYEICPAHFSKSTAFLLYNYLVELKNISNQFSVSESSSAIFGFKDYGVTFSFQRFLLYLIRSSLICYDNRIDPSKFTCSTSLEKLNLLLERMQISPGFLSIQKRTHSTNNQHTSLLIPSSLVTLISVSKSIDWSTPRASQFSGFRSSLNSKSASLRGSENEQRSFLDTVNFAQKNNSRSSSSQLGLRQSFVSEILSAPTICYDVINRNKESLQKLFSSYCQIGEPMNQTTLKSIKLIKLLTDAGIMKKTLTQSISSSSKLNLSNVSRNSLNQHFESSSKKSSMVSAAQDVEEDQTDEYCQNEDQVDSNQTETKQFKKIYLSRVDMDFMVAKLSGHKWIQSINSFANKGRNQRVSSPNLGFKSHLFRNDNSVGAKGKIEFQHFLKLIERIAEKLYPEIELSKSLSLIIEGQLLKIDPNKLKTTVGGQSRKTVQEYLIILMETLKDPEIVNLLSEVHLSLLLYYKLYNDLKGFMNVTKFIQFFLDFDIFPSMLSKASISTIFYALASIQKTTNSYQEIQQSRNDNTRSNSNRSRMLNDSNLRSTAVDQNEKDYIDQNLFVEGIALCAIEIYSEQPSNMFKIIMMLERINNSKGPEKIKKKLGHTRSTDGQHWDILHSIRKKYPEFYRQATDHGYRSSRRSSTQNKVDSFQFKPGNFEEFLRQSLARNLNDSHQIQQQQEEQNRIEPYELMEQQRHSYYGSGAEQEK